MLGLGRLLVANKHSGPVAAKADVPQAVLMCSTADGDTPAATTAA